MPHPCLKQIGALKPIFLHIDVARIIQDRGISAEEQNFNKAQFGVRFPSAISEAIIKVALRDKDKRAATTDAILKVDSGASVSLAHPDLLTDVGNCTKANLPPVILSGIGGKTETMTKVGTLTIIKTTGQKIKIKCYAFDQVICDSEHLCLVSNWAIDHYHIDLQFHNFTSLRHGPQTCASRTQNH